MIFLTRVIFFFIFISVASLAQIQSSAAPEEARLPRCGSLTVPVSACSLSEAIEKNNIDAVQLFLISGHQAYEADGMPPELPLVTACLYGYMDIIALLLARGAQINARSSTTDKTALFATCYHFPINGYLVNYLLDQGADPNITSFGNWTPLYVVCKHTTDIELVKLLLKHKAIVNSKSDCGRTPLLAACLYGSSHQAPSSLELVKLLLDAHADANIVADDGWTPLIAACLASPINIDLVQLLLIYKANANPYPMYSGTTPIMSACRQGRRDVVELLMRYGAQVDSIVYAHAQTPEIQGILQPEVTRRCVIM